LAIFELLGRIHTVLARYLGDVTDDSLRQNFSTVYLLLDEMIDSGLPFTTDMNSLESIITPPTAINKVVQAVSGSSLRVSEVSHESKGPVWWRRPNVTHVSNEIYVDVVDTVDCILDSRGQIISGGVRGDVHVNSKLSGVPQVMISLRDPSILEKACFHPCVRLHRYERDRNLCFVPPDGAFILASYWIRDLALNFPFNFTASVNFHADVGRLQMSAGVKTNFAMDNTRIHIDSFCVNVQVPSSIVSATLSSGGGNVRFDDENQIVVWNIGQLSRQDMKAEATLIYGCDPKNNSPTVPSEEKCTAQIAYVIKGWSISGIKIDTCDVAGVHYSPYKANRYTTTSGKVELRIA